jgi:hypothetical protein
MEQQYQKSSERIQRSNNITSSPCVQIPRLRYGTVEAHVPNQSTFASTINTSMYRYATLRWQIHARTDNYGMNRISKTIIDLNRVHYDDLYNNFPIVESIHKPIPSYCKQRKLHIRSTEQLFVIHHYLGTYEQYSFRSDSRISNERSEKVRVLLRKIFTGHMIVKLTIQVIFFAFVNRCTKKLRN